MTPRSRLFRPGGKVIYSHTVKTPGGDRRGTRRAVLSGQGFRRCFYKNGVLTIEHIIGTRRVFLSFHYQSDTFRVSQIKLMRNIAPSREEERFIRLPAKFGVAVTLKRGRGRGPKGRWQVRRCRLGRIFAEDTWRDMDGRSIYGNEWENVSSRGNKAIRKWINKQMRNKRCVVVLIGSDTANRRWINYEIEHAWDKRKGLLGIYVHNLKDPNIQAPKGLNPFDYVSKNGRRLSQAVRTYDPPFTDSKEVYNYIRTNLDSWIEEAIQVRRAS
jgi:hypothetical protein